MDVTKMLSDLREEREQIEEAIMTLERLARGRGKRRGRPPLWLQEAKKRTDVPVVTPKVKSSAKTA
jgi:DNA invertase Pin-like site-specific DNA recombinase